jgi:hypothetical protein
MWDLRCLSMIYIGVIGKLRKFDNQVIGSSPKL